MEDHSGSNVEGFRDRVKGTADRRDACVSKQQKQHQPSAAGKVALTEAKGEAHRACHEEETERLYKKTSFF